MATHPEHSLWVDKVRAHWWTKKARPVNNLRKSYHTFPHRHLSRFRQRDCLNLPKRRKSCALQAIAEAKPFLEDEIQLDNLKPQRVLSRSSHCRSISLIPMLTVARQTLLATTKDPKAHWTISVLFGQRSFKRSMIIWARYAPWSTSTAHKTPLMTVKRHGSNLKGKRRLLLRSIRRLSHPWPNSVWRKYNCVEWPLWS